MFLTDSTSEHPSLLTYQLSSDDDARDPLDIKEVLLFPAMKPIETAANTNPTQPGPGGQV